MTNAKSLTPRPLTRSQQIPERCSQKTSEPPSAACIWINIFYYSATRNFHKKKVYCEEVFFSLLNESTHNNELASQHRKLYIHQEKEFFSVPCFFAFSRSSFPLIYGIFSALFHSQKTFRFESGENCADACREFVAQLWEWFFSVSFSSWTILLIKNT
jgi:hypothetical protein